MSAARYRRLLIAGEVGKLAHVAEANRSLEWRRRIAFLDCGDWRAGDPIEKDEPALAPLQERCVVADVTLKLANDAFAGVAHKRSRSVLLDLRARHEGCVRLVALVEALDEQHQVGHRHRGSMPAQQIDEPKARTKRERRLAARTPQEGRADVAAFLLQEAEREHLLEARLLSA